MQPRQSNRGLKLIVAVLVLLLLGWLVWAFAHRMPSVGLPYAVQAGTALTTASPTTGGGLIIASGSSFVSYDPATGRSTSLGPGANSGLSNPDTVTQSSNRQFILFHQFVSDVPSALVSSLTAHNLPANTDYWWVYVSGSHSFLPLPDSTLIAKLHDSQVVALAATGSGEALITYSVPDLQTVSSVPVSAVSDFFPLPSGYLLQTSAGDVLYTTDGIVSKKVLPATNLVGVTGDGRYALATQTSNKVQNLLAIKLADYSTKVVAKNISGQTAWNNDGIVLFSQQQGTSTTNSELTYYDAVSGKLGRWSVGKNGALNAARPISVFGDSSGVVQTADGSYFIVSSSQLSSAVQNL